MSAFGSRLRELRKAKGLSLRDLAQQISVDFTYLSKIELGQEAPPSSNVIHRIAMMIEADEAELISLTGKVPLNLKKMLAGNPLLTELVRVLSEQKLPDEVYRKMIDLAREEEGR